MGCDRSSEEEELETLDVPTSAVTTLDAFTHIENPEKLYTIEDVMSYPAGTTLYSTGDEIAAALCTGVTANPLSTLALVNLEDGKAATVLEKAEASEEGFVIHAVRASDDLIVWVESNYLTSDWRVYSARIRKKSMHIGSISQLDAGDRQYDVPEIAVIGSTAYWIVQPAQDGERTSEDSLLKASSAGSAAAVIYTSHGRFNGGLSVSGNTLCAMPRVDTDKGIYYQMTAIQDGAGAVIASQILPQSFKPVNAIYLDTGFSFSIGASYDYGGGIGLVGTYYPLGNGEWLRLIKQPVTPAGTCRGWLFCKSGSRTVFVNPNERSYFTIDAPDNCKDYGDYSVRVGQTNLVYNYAALQESKDGDNASNVILRRIKPKHT